MILFNGLPNFLACPAGAIQSVQCDVMGFDKGRTIACNHALNALDYSVSVNITGFDC